MTESHGARLYMFIARLWLAVCLIAALANMIALGGLATRASARRGGSEPGLEAALRQASPQVDAAALARETRREYVHEFFVQFRERPGTGRYVNVEPAGFRRSAAPAPWPPDADGPNVFLLGGSTAFGYGVADAQTLAAALESRLAAYGHGRAPRLYNFGRGGYFSVQERILFEELLVAGARPDVAIFVDGANEFVLADGRPALTAMVERLTRRKQSQSLRFDDLPVLRLFGDQTVRTPPLGFPVSMAPPEENPTLPATVVERYLRNRRLTEKEAAAVGVRTLFVWQPSAVGADTTEMSWPARLAAEGYRRLSTTVNDHTPEPGFAWCAGERPAQGDGGYLDGVHYTPAMTARLADCIAAAIERDGLAR